MLRKPKEVIMKKRMFLEGVPLKASLLLFGIFLVLAVASHPLMVAAQTVRCADLQVQCINKCDSNYDPYDFGEGKGRNYGCKWGCIWYAELCLKHLGEIIRASAEEEMFLAEVTLRVFEKVVDKEDR
jgi:hypothetical protein